MTDVTAVRPQVRPENAAKSKKLRPDIQGLRAFAVVAVILGHLFHWPTGGFIGVDVFFVISGFLITGMLLREHQKTGHISFAGFYRRRVRRIVPVATLVIVVTVVAAFVLLPTDRATSAGSDGLWAFLFAGNWHLAIAGSDYFQLGLPPSPLQHYWSLSVEEQFYCAWPWMMLGLFSLSAKVRWSRPAQKKLILVAFLVVTAVSFLWSLHESASNPRFAYFSTFSRAWELGVGAIVAVSVPLFHRIPDVLRPFLGWAGLIGITTCVFSITPGAAFPGPGAAVPVLSAAVFIAAGTGARGRSHFRSMAPITNRVSSYVGNISYSLYLWHFPVIVLALAFFPAGSGTYIVVCVAAMITLAVLSYHFVEDPIRRSNWLERGPASRQPFWRGRVNARTGAVGIGIVTVVALVVIGLGITAKAHGEASARSGPALCAGADFMAGTHDPTCNISKLDNVTTPSVDSLAGDPANTYKCWRAKGGTFRSCNFGSSSPNAKRVAIVGDSHAAMLMPAVIDRLHHLNWSVDTFTGYGCQWKSALEGDCAAQMAQTATALNTGKPYDLVITAGARWVSSDAAAASTAYSAAWNTVVARGTKVVVIADPPDVSAEAIACISRVGFQANDNDCGTPRDAALRKTDPLVEAVAHSPGTSLVDMTDFYCRSSFCPSVIGNTIVYRDTAGHVTAPYMKSLGPYLLDRILRAEAH